MQSEIMGFGILSKDKYIFVKMKIFLINLQGKILLYLFILFISGSYSHKF